MSDRPCGNRSCSCSTSIGEFLTFGSGELDEDGFWEYPCLICAQHFELQDRAEGLDKEHPDWFPYWPRPDDIKENAPKVPRYQDQLGNEFPAIFVVLETNDLNEREQKAACNLTWYQVDKELHPEFTENVILVDQGDLRNYFDLPVFLPTLREAGIEPTSFSRVVYIPQGNRRVGQDGFYVLVPKRRK